MRNSIKLTAAAAALLGLAQPALADQAETKGGITVKTDDGRFSASLGGRIHFDVNIFDADEDSFATGTPQAGSAANGQPSFAGSRLTPNNSTAYLRRVYLTLKGKLYGWNYKIEPDLANNTQTGATTISFQDVTMSTDVLGGELIFGQFKPYRSLEDLISSNDVLLIERPYTSSNGVFAGREFQQGVGYKYPIMEGLLAEASLFSLRGSTTAANAGTGYNARIAYAPLMQDGLVVHVGANYTYENTTNDSAKVGAASGGIKETESYAGRRGPTLNMGATSGDEPATTMGFEVATVLGPFFLQGEYADSKLSQASPAQDQSIKAMYAQIAFELTGEHKPYKPADGSFGSIKPLGDYGAFELVARYDTAKNDDIVLGKCSVTTTAANPAVAANTNTSGSATVALTNADKCQATTVTAGLNWYANPNTRFMFNYVMGDADMGAAGTDKPKAYVLRTQISF